jgi:membrane protein DedA with SNARE-associated domain
VTTLAVAVPAHLGYLVLVLLIAGESAGVPLPGETALLTGGVLASRGDLSIELVIVLAAAAAIVGDNIGYAIGRAGGRRLILGPGPLQRQRTMLVERSEPFFARHGPKAVFLGRWFAGLRIAAAWMAGIARMPWPLFLFYNAAGGILWACTIGLLAYALGSSVDHLITTFGIAGLAVIAIVIAGVVVVRRRRDA